MELLRLGSFYKNVNSWPKAELELAPIADRLRELFDVPLAVIWIHEIGISPSTQRQLGGVSTDRISEFAKTQIEHVTFLATQEFTQPKQRQLSKDVLDLGADQQISHLVILPIQARETRERKEDRKELGWILLGSTKMFSPRIEILLAAAAQHLSYVGTVQQLDTALGMRDQFLSISSHELKTPLTSIYGVLQLQERMLRPKKDVAPNPDQEKQRSFFKIVIRQVERLNELIDGLLDVSRIQNGRFMVEPSDTDAGTILQDTVASRLNVIAAEAGVRLHVDTDNVKTGWVDPVRFEEVVTNLGMNAIRFSPEGGMVWMKLRSDSGSLILSVRDQGPNVPDADRNRIFLPFERAHRTARLGGLGLGLFISRQIAQLHGGDVALAESIPGKGNLFEARFPVRAAQKVSA